MAVPVLTAVSDSAWESDLVAALEREPLGVAVVRRCVDLADLLATAATGQACAVLLSADLRRLDRDALSHLATAGLAVLGLVPPGNEEAERRLRQLGVQRLLPADALAAEVSAAVIEAVQALAAAPPDSAEASWGDPRRALPEQGTRSAAHDGARGEAVAGTGRVVAVWGPTGAPGRTTVAVALASELALLGGTALLVDADVYGGVVAQSLGLLDESAGLAAAARLANAGSLDLPALAGLARAVTPSLRVLTGISRADRWPELRPASVGVVLALARSLARTTVVDVGFCLEQDEELVYDTAAPRRNGATTTALEVADVVVAVGSADPVGLMRLVRALGELKELLPQVQPVVVVNRLRASAVPGDAAAEVRGALSRYAGVSSPVLVPMDVAGLDAALSTGRTLAEAATASPARLALAALAADLAGTGVARPPRAGRRRAARRA